MDHSKQLGESKVSSLIIKFSIPAIVAMLVNGLYNVVDRIFVGQGVGPLAIAGISIGFPIMLVIMACMMLIGLGANALLSIKLGEGNKKEAEHIMGNAITLFIIISAVITFFGLLFLDPMLKAFGASKEVLPYARQYMQIILAGAVFQGFSFGLNNFIRGEGNPRIAMITMLFGAVLNAVLCAVFIFGFHMGIKGSAIATVIAQAASGIWILAYFFSKRSTLKIRAKNLKLNRRIVIGILAIGSAPFAMQMASSLVNVILNKSLVNYGGDLAISGMGIVIAIQTLVIMPFIGINQGAQPIIGYNYGAKNYDRVKQALKYAILGSTLLAFLGLILVEVFPRQLVTLFINKNETELIEFTTYALRTFLILLPLIALQLVSAAYFSAVGKPKQAAFLSLSRQLLLLIPAVLILPIFYKLHGVIIAGPVADFCSTIITGIWILNEMKKLKLGHEKSEAMKKRDEIDVF
ncbi:MAG: MATE family efflux transporter [Clostridia bacterium]|jgi:putative MATE family efflux protein